MQSVVNPPAPPSDKSQGQPLDKQTASLHTESKKSSSKKGKPTTLNSSGKKMSSKLKDHLHGQQIFESVDGLLPPDEKQLRMNQTIDHSVSAKQSSAKRSKKTLESK